MGHPAGVDCPGQPSDLGQSKATLDAELSVGASDGFSGVEVQQLFGVVEKPHYVNGCRTEAGHQADKFTRALEQRGRRLAGRYTSCGKEGGRKQENG